MASKREKLLERARRSTRGWTSREIGQLLRGWGFSSREGSNHTVYFHPKNMASQLPIPRHPGELPPVYVRKALQLIEEVL